MYDCGCFFGRLAIELRPVPHPFRALQRNGWDSNQLNPVPFQSLFSAFFPRSLQSSMGRIRTQKKMKVRHNFTLFNFNNFAAIFTADN